MYCKVGVSVVPKPLLERLLFHEFVFNLGLNLVVLELGMLSLIQELVNVHWMNTFFRR